MRVLVVAYYFPPLGGGGVHRTLQWVRHLAERGDEPWVLTVDDAAWAHDPEGLRRIPEVARVVRVPNPDWGRVADWRDRRRSVPRGSRTTPGPGRLRRWLVPDLAVGWSALAIPAALALTRTARFDAVYTTAPPYSAHGVGWALSRQGLPWLADFRDGWLDCPTRVDFGPARRRLESRLEAAVFARAGSVVFAGAAAHERAVRRCPDLAARSTTVLTGFAPEDPAPMPAPSGPTLRLVHAGSIGLNQMASSFGRFLDALVAWRARRPDAHFALRLLGAEAGLSGEIGARGLQDWVMIAPAVPRAALGRELAAAHAALVLSADAPFGTDPIPGKCFDAIAAGRPLLAWTPAGGLADWVATAGTGVVIDPAEPRALGRQLDRWLDAVRNGGLPTLTSGERAAFAAPESMERIRERVVALVAAGGGNACASA